MLKRFRLGTVFDVPLDVDVTLFAVIPLVAWLIASRVGEMATLLGRTVGVSVAPGFAAGAWPWLLGFAAAVGLFASVALHELGHAVVARRSGYEIDSITLWVLGGVANFASRPDGWREELRVALAGPAVSVALVAAGFLVLRVTPGSFDRVEFLVGYLTLMNAVLAGFNLLPAFPMDGGRVVRALLARNRPLPEATRQAARAGKVMAFLLALLGLLAFNIFLVAIALFVYVGASAESTRTAMRAAFEDTAARDLMTPASDLDTVSPDTTVAALLDRMYRERHTGYPVVDDGRPVGVVTLEDLGDVPPSARAETAVAEVMSTDLVTVSPDGDAVDAYQRMGEDRIGRLLVVDDAGELVGLLSRSDLARAFEISQSSPRNLPRGAAG
ncbi:CBS domain-containing protein [Haloplanus sp. GCM10025708]|uniref:CBS domain-containing protein n=1 Tax=Haloferacaceae TaxID=1644056 RepID=UPI00360AB478